MLPVIKNHTSFEAESWSKIPDLNRPFSLEVGLVSSSTLIFETVRENSHFEVPTQIQPIALRMAVLLKPIFL